MKTTKTKVKFTTVALNDNQHLVRVKRFDDTWHEAYFIGYENGKRYHKLDGFYFRSDVSVKTNN